MPLLENTQRISHFNYPTSYVLIKCCSEVRPKCGPEACTEPYMLVAICLYFYRMLKVSFDVIGTHKNVHNWNTTDSYVLIKRCSEIGLDTVFSIYCASIVLEGLPYQTG